MWQILPIIALGLIAGVFVNYLSDILPIRRRLAGPLCTTCGNGIDWSHYVLWQRQCSKCGERRGPRIWVVNMMMMALFGALGSIPEMSSKLGFWLGAIVLIYFAVIFVIDLEFKLILHPTSWFGLILGVAVGWILHGPTKMLIGGLVGFAVMLVLYLMGGAFVRLLKKTDETALGFGDVNLMGILGLMVGWPVILLVIFMTIFIAGAFSILFLLISLLFRRYQSFTALPYGPFLLLAASFVLYFPEQTKIVLQSLWPGF